MTGTMIFLAKILVKSRLPLPLFFLLQSPKALQALHCFLLPAVLRLFPRGPDNFCLSYVLLCLFFFVICNMFACLLLKQQCGTPMSRTNGGLLAYLRPSATALPQASLGLCFVHDSKRDDEANIGIPCCTCSNPSNG